MQDGIVGEIPRGTQIGRPVPRDPLAKLQFETTEEWQHFCKV